MKCNFVSYDFIVFDVVAQLRGIICVIPVA